MGYYQTPATVKEALTGLTVDDLKTLITLLPTNERPKRKADFIKEFMKFYTVNGIQELLKRTSELEKLALMETAHSSGYQFNYESFEAKYGKLPSFGEGLYGYRWGRNKEPLPLLRIFFLDSLTLPTDLKTILKDLLPKPKKVSLKIAENIPTSVPCKGYRARRKESSIHYFSAESTVHADLGSVLRLIDAGKVTVGEKTGMPSSIGLTRISEALLEPDLLANCDAPDEWEKLTPIRPFAWTLLVISGGLAKPFGKTLKLTKSGQQAIAEDPIKIRKQLFESWVTAGYDEVMRNDKIKGKTGKGKSSLSKPPGRRKTITASLKECPIEEWIHIDDFTRYLRASGHNSLVAVDECWNLYVSDQQYGALGYDSTNYWGLLDGPWLRCLLMEYFATLGVIDIAYVDPHGARDDFRDHWGVDDFSFIGQHDGLLYFKLTKFGAYCLGIEKSYATDAQGPNHLFVATANLQLSVIDGNLPLGDKMLIELYCSQVSDLVWKLDEKKILSQLEGGRAIDHLEKYLQSHVKNDLPDTMKRFIEDIRSRAAALSHSGSASIIQCSDSNLAKLLANDSKTKKFCFYADGGRLIIPYGMEKKFRAGVKKLGYFLPT